MPYAQYSESVTIAGYTFSRNVVREADHPNPYQIALPVAHAVTDWVKTDADTAAGNLAGGHGQTTGTYDVYWEGGSRYGVTITVTANALALDGGAGDDFPATANATVVICKQVTINTHIDGDAAKFILIRLGYVDEATEAVGRLLFEDGTGDDIADLDEADGVVANQIVAIDVEGGETNPLAGDAVVSCKASHNNTVAAATLIIATLEDSTP